MSSLPPINLRAIAAELNISRTAVSLALRNRPGVSAELRAKVLECARRLGYAPNPVAVELMSIVRSQRQPRNDGQLIAYINTFSVPERYEDPNAGYMLFNKGAADRAAEFGYSMEMFNARANGMTGARLTRILKARGVRGVLVGPRCMDEPDIDLDWKAFSTVLVGSEKYGVCLYRVCNHHVHTCSTTLRHLSGLGYRRIGVVFVQRYEASRGFDFLLGVEQFRRENPDASHVEVLLYREWDHARFSEWAIKHDLDAVVSLEPYVWPSVQALVKKTGRHVGYAGFSVYEGDGLTGVNQHYEAIGAASMDLLRTLMLSGARGVLPRPQMLLVEGDWVAGTTAPGVPSQVV